MLGLDQRTIRILWTILAFAAVLGFLYTARESLITFTLAIFLAYVLAPFVDWLYRSAPSWMSHGLALGVVYLVLVILVAGAIIMVGSTGAEQAANLAARIPELLRGDMLANMDVPGWMIPLRDRLIEALRGNANEVGKDVMPLIGSAAGGLATGLDLMVHGILIPIVAFFFLKDGRHIRTTLIEMSPEEHRYTVMGILDDLSHLLENYIRALLILSLATFVCYLTFLEITGAPYAELLALVAGFFEFIPAIGPFIAATTIILVAVISGYKQWLLLLGFFAVYRLFQDYILQPALMSQGVELHPLLVLFGALAGAEIAGVPGVFFSVPLMAGARMIYYRIYQRKVESPVI